MDSSNNNIERLQNINANTLLREIAVSGLINTQTLEDIAAKYKISVDVLGKALITGSLNANKANLSLRIELIRLIREEKKLLEIPLKELEQILNSTSYDNLDNVLDQLTNQPNISLVEKTSVSKLMKSIFFPMFFNLQSSIEKETLDQYGVSLMISEIRNFQAKNEYDPISREQLAQKLTILMEDCSKKLDDNSIASGSSGPRFEQLNQDLKKIRKILDQLELLLVVLKLKSTK